MARPQKNEESVQSLLETADQGSLLEDADKHLRELIEAVTRNGGKGEITIKIKVAEIKGKDAVAVTPELSLKKPAPARLPKPYYVTAEHGLSRKHGSQPSMPGLEPDEQVDEDGVVTKLRQKTQPSVQ